jgi:hypothetical protein
MKAMKKCNKNPCQEDEEEIHHDERGEIVGISEKFQKGIKSYLLTAN